MARGHLAVGAAGVDGTGLQSGGVYVYASQGAPSHVSQWALVEKIMPADGAHNHSFGGSVALSSYAATTQLLVGAHGWAAFRGAVYVYEQLAVSAVGEDGRRWALRDTLTARGGRAGERLGLKVAVAGDLMAANAIGGDPAGPWSGAVVLFLRDAAGLWVEQQRVWPASATADGWFGYQLALHPDGNWLAAAAKRRSGLAEAVGVVYVYGRAGDGAWSLAQTLEPLHGEDRDAFGVGLAIQGDVLVVGSSGDDTFGAEAGSVYTFTLLDAAASSEPWGFNGKLAAPDAAAGANFGGAVALAGTYMLVGAPGVGAAYTFERSGGDGAWAFITSSSADDERGGAAATEFGRAVALCPPAAAVGAPRTKKSSQSTGAVFTFG